MAIYDAIETELLEQKSLSALIWLINRGRELEFSYKREIYFLSCDKAQKYVSLWHGEDEQSFESVEQLTEEALVENQLFLDIWAEVTMITLF